MTELGCQKKDPSYIHILRVFIIAEYNQNQLI